MINTKEGMKSLLEVTKDNYIVPKGEEQVVHYTTESVNISNEGKRLSKPILCKTDVKLFDTIVLRNLELQGYAVNIVYHPNGKYNHYEPVMDAETVRRSMEAENEALRAELEALKSVVKPSVKAAKTAEIEPEATKVEESPKETVKAPKRGRKGGKK